MHGKFHAIVKLTQEMDKAPRKFGTDELLSHSEIHLIEIIGDNSNLSVTDIARSFGVTKGAVSQILKRLEQKGYTEKKPDPDNLSRSIVFLTSKGHTSYYAHKHWHEKMDGGFSKYLGEMSQGEFDTIYNFLCKVEDLLKRRIEAED